MLIVGNHPLLAVPEYMQIAEMLVMPTNQATGTIVSRK